MTTDASVPILITDNAAAKVGDLLAEEGRDDLKPRIFVSGGGCSGFRYGFTSDESTGEDHMRFEKNEMPRYTLNLAAEEDRATTAVHAVPPDSLLHPVTCDVCMIRLHDSLSQTGQSQQMSCSPPHHLHRFGRILPEIAGCSRWHVDCFTEGRETRIRPNHDRHRYRQ